MALKYAENYLTETDYLDGEKQSQVKHELIDGDVYAMTGASDNHNKISGNIFAELRHILKQKESPCTPYVNDMKVKINPNFFYPDVMVICQKQEEENAYYKTHPVIIIEVLSPSTRRIDKTLKKLAYQSLSSLQEYVLIEQGHVEIAVFTRSSSWQVNHYYLGDKITFESIDVTVPVLDIYYQVDNKDVTAYLAE